MPRPRRRWSWAEEGMARAAVISWGWKEHNPASPTLSLLCAKYSQQYSLGYIILNIEKTIKNFLNSGMYKEFFNKNKLVYF